MVRAVEAPVDLDAADDLPLRPVIHVGHLSLNAQKSSFVQLRLTKPTAWAVYPDTTNIGAGREPHPVPTTASGGATTRATAFVDGGYVKGFETFLNQSADRALN